MTYVLENINAKGQYLAKDMETAWGSGLESGDVTEIENTIQFKDAHELMLWSADAGVHRTIMKMKFGKDALVTLDIKDVLENYRPVEVE